MLRPPVPEVEALTDPGRPLAPVAARVADSAWATEIDPIGTLVVDVADETDPEAGDVWYLSIPETETAAAFEAAFGPRPGRGASVPDVAAPVDPAAHGR